MTGQAGRAKDTSPLDGLFTHAYENQDAINRTLSNKHTHTRKQANMNISSYRRRCELAMVVKSGAQFVRYCLAPRCAMPLLATPALSSVCVDLERITEPEARHRCQAKLVQINAVNATHATMYFSLHMRHVRHTTDWTV